MNFGVIVAAIVNEEGDQSAEDRQIERALEEWRESGYITVEGHR